MTDTHDILNELNSIPSEAINSASEHIDLMSTVEVLQCINEQDALVAPAVSKAIPDISKAVDVAVDCLKDGGRLIYIGAGTSGRLGILDAVECRPTFSVSDNIVVGLIAGGERALIHAVEGAEDDSNAAQQDLENIQFSKKDMLIGLAASGRTPYVIGALKFANSLNATTACIVCNPQAPLIDIADIGICANVGPEVLTGSTRMKSGTAQKLILNMISTASMIKLGKTYKNLMVDVNATNQKLLARAIRIVMQATDCEESVAVEALAISNNNAKLAILKILTNNDIETCENLLKQSDGFLRTALNSNQ
ncbi:N-acetylmuramic acid 6-phosphate etherase [Glaciecola sp. MF2-115]|uniref:N-acetylmuramic acid 6-phosphate etherase n=1 Tax=Glaciecola sp. MF2-115 TaxID=3384827 RepID=UPI0039A2317C